MNRATIHLVLFAVFAAAVFACAFIAGGCNDSPLRFAPGEAQKQTRQAAADIAREIDRDGTAPSTPATAVLVQSTREAALDAGYPSEPINVADLFPPPDATAAQAAAADAAAQAAIQTANQAAIDAQRRPGATDVAGGLLDEAGWWLGALAAIGVPVAGVAQYVRRGKALVQSRAEYERQRDSAYTIVQQTDTLLNGPLGQTTVQYAGATMTLAELAKSTIYAGQDAATKALVDEAQAAAKVQ
jgi:hypothetical protein